MAISEIVAICRASPDWQATECALKCYAASMLAYYCALRIGLQNPYWALTTCYITVIPNPLAGAVITKAIYRTIGTFLGVTAAVVLVPCLDNAPLLLSLALSLWLCICTYISLLDRKPRSYVFLLAGYTASIIGFPSVETPGNIFNVAILREQEIVLGIICSSLMHGAVFPRTLTGRLQLRLDQILAEVENWSAQSLGGHRDASLDSTRRALAGELNELSALAVQVRFDTARNIPNLVPLNALQDQLTLLLPIMVAVEDRLAELTAAEAVPASVTEVTCRIATWLRCGIRDSEFHAASDVLIKDVRRLLTGLIEGSAWHRMLTLNLLYRLQDLITLHRNARTLRYHLQGVAASAIDGDVARMIRATQPRSLHRDHLTAAWVGMSAGITVFSGCLFWIATEWPSGSSAVLIAAIMAAFFGHFPNSDGIVRRYLWGVVVGIGIAALYGFALLPRVTDPVMFAAVLAPPLLVLGALLSRPTTALLSNAATIGFINTVGLAAVYQRDFAAFANASLALTMGIGFSAAILSVARLGSTHVSAMRLLKSAYRDVALRAAGGDTHPSSWTSRMLDRTGLLTTVGFLKTSGLIGSPMDVLIDMRTGYLAGCLRGLRDSATNVDVVALETVLRGITRYYLERNPRTPGSPPEELLHDIDLGVGTFNLQDAAPSSREGIAILTGLRRNLFPSAPPYSAPLAETL